MILLNNKVENVFVYSHSLGSPRNIQKHMNLRAEPAILSEKHLRFGRTTHQRQNNLDASLYVGQTNLKTHFPI
jgi:hypothetical protein